MSKFKVGDKLIPKRTEKCVNFGNSAKYIQIREVCDDGSYWYNIFDGRDNKVGGCGICFKDEDLELLEEEYKVGDVVLLEENKTFGKEIYKITEIKGDYYEGDCLSSEEDKGCRKLTSTKSEIIKKLHEPIEHFKYKNPKYFPEVKMSVDWGVKPGQIITEDFISFPPNLDTLKPNKPKERNIMRKLSQLSQKVRRAFSSDQKALWKAGYIDDCGNWMDEAHNAVVDMLCDEKKKELVDLANEEIGLAKQEKKEDD